MSTALRSVPGVAPSAADLLARVRAAWRTGVVLRALLLGAALGVAAALTLVLLDLLVPLPAAARAGLRWLSPLLAVGVLGWGAVRAARAPDARRFALLVEERSPALGNRLLTLLAAPAAEGPVARAFRADAEARLAGVYPRAVAPLELRTPMAALAGATALAVALGLLAPGAADEAWKRWSAPADAYPSAWREVRAEAIPIPAPPAPPPGFDELRWTVQPPRYTGLSARELRGEVPPAVLPGSTVRLRSRFATGWDAVRATAIGGGALPVRRSDGEWQVGWRQTAGGRGVVLEAMRDGRTVARRVAPLLPATDHPPQVRLLAPAKDLVLAAANGHVPIRAVARDDFGVGDFRLTWIRSRGSGESFTFAEGEAEWAELRRTGDGTVGERSLDLAAMGLEPGDVIHLRAVARDRNTVTGPGTSVSETRILRIARPDEADQVNTTVAFPLEVEKHPVLSQRMLILLTERLRDQTPRMERPAVLREGAEIGSDQGRLRARVGEQVFTRSTGALASPDGHTGFEDASAEAHVGDSPEDGDAAPPSPSQTLAEAERATGQGTADELGHRHDEAPIIAVNRVLVSIYNAMWAAERELNQGNAAAALPHQYLALRLLKEMQAGERVYARGAVRVDPVDVAAARGTGEVAEAAPAIRSAAEGAPPVSPTLAELDRIAALLRGGTRASAPALADLAARLLADPVTDPRAGALVARAAEAAAHGRTGEARRSVAAAREILDPPVTGGTAPPLPDAADPAAAEYFRRLGAGGG